MATRQKAVAQLGRGHPDIDRVWKNFRKTTVGELLADKLRALFRWKCAYCERVVTAGAIDHFYPKNQYPKRMFSWGNLLLCCMECNHAKGKTFHFLNGRPCFLDPTRDQPRECYLWDLQTGGMAPVPVAEHEERANFTRDELGLDADSLRIERAERVQNIIYFLLDVVKESPITDATKIKLRKSLTVELPYLGILDYLFHVPNHFTLLVDAARAKLPEIDTWLAAWA
jgi:uncharacterized protein (TIGR02646 family)